LRFLAQKYQIVLNKEYFLLDKATTPAYLIWHYGIIQNNKQIAVGDDLQKIFQHLKAQGLVKEILITPKEQFFYQEWLFEDLPDSLHKTIHHKKVLVYPALRDEDNQVSIQYYNTPELALQIHTQGLIKLIALALDKEIKYLHRQSMDKTLQKQVSRV